MKKKLNIIYEDDGVGVSAQISLCSSKKDSSTGGTSGTAYTWLGKMIEVYGWTIEENGEIGKGAKFVITIPRLNQKGKENYRIAS